MFCFHADAKYSKRFSKPNKLQLRSLLDMFVLEERRLETWTQTFHWNLKDTSLWSELQEGQQALRRIICSVWSRRFRINSSTVTQVFMHKCFCCPDTRLPSMTRPVHRVYLRWERQRQRFFLSSLGSPSAIAAKSSNQIYSPVALARILLLQLSMERSAALKSGLNPSHSWPSSKVTELNTKCLVAALLNRITKKKKKKLCKQVHQSKQTEANVC